MPVIGQVSSPTVEHIVALYYDDHDGNYSNFQNACRRSLAPCGKSREKRLQSDDDGRRFRRPNAT